MLGDPLRERQSGRIERGNFARAGEDRANVRRRLSQARSGYDESVQLARTERHAHDVADAELETRRNAIRQRSLERGRALLHDHLDEVGQRNSASPGLIRARASTARTVRAGTTIPYSTSPRARGKTKRNVPLRDFLSEAMAA